MTALRVNPSFKLEDQRITGARAVHYNLIEPALVEAAVMRGEARLGLGGAVLASTGTHTGRSPKDKFVVRTPSVENSVWWENNAPMAPEAFDRLHADMLEHVKGRELFVQDLYGGADATYRLDVRVVTELAWHGLFIRHMLRRPDASELAPQPDRDRAELRQEADPHREHGLCGREQEISIHASELPAARQGRDADALLGQPRNRQSGRVGGVLWSVGHWQDHAFRGPIARADWR